MRLVQPMAYPYLFDLKTIMVFFRKKRKNGSLHFDKTVYFFSHHLTFLPWFLFVLLKHRASDLE
jgi:hypothetical protein